MEFTVTLDKHGMWLKRISIFPLFFPSDLDAKREVKYEDVSLGVRR